MKEKFISYRDAIIGNSLWDGIKLIFAFLTGGSIFGYAATIISVYYQLSLRYRIPVTIIAITAFTWIFLEILSKLSNNKPNMPVMDCEYAILKRDMYFEYNKDYCKYRIEMKIKSKKDNLDRFYGKYTWSGSGKAILKSTNRSHNLIELVRKDAYTEYELLFNQTYRKNDIVNFSIEGYLPDPDNSFVPFLSTQIITPTNKINVHITIPPIYGIREVICESMAATRKNDEISKTHPLNDEGKFHWEIKNPKLLYIYIMRWQLP